MNTQALLISIVAGLAAAVFSAAPFSASGLGVLLSIFAPLPLFVASLGWGSLAGIIAAVTSIVVTAVIGSSTLAMSIALTAAIPAAWAGHMAGLWRQDDSGTEHWFPLTTILSRLALYCAGAVIVGGLISGFDPESAKQSLVKFMSGMSAPRNGSAAIDPNMIEATAEFYTFMVPILVPMTLLFLLIINMNLAARITRAMNKLRRPKDDIPASVSLPISVLGIFAVAIVASMLGGGIGILGQVISGAIGFALALVGLATMHFLTRGNSARGLLLWGSYIAILFSVIPLAIFTVFGIAEILLQLRARKSAPQSPHS